MKRKKWLDVPGFEIYQICLETEEVKSIERFVLNKGKKTSRKIEEKMLKPSPYNGYIFYSLYKNGKCNNVSLHSIILNILIGPCPPGMQCCHKDDNRSNNNPDNIYWGTPKQNGEDAVRNGRYRNGEKHFRSKLTKREVKEIRKMYATGKYSYREIGNKFGIGRGAIFSVVHYITWKDV